MSVAGLTLRGLTKRFDGVSALDGIDLEVAPGEFMVLVGPSGSGKSTALRIVAGLEDPTSGTVKIGERDVGRVSARDRDVAMIFQDYALYPHMTCAQNIAYALKVRGMKKAEIQERVLTVARMLGLEELLGRRPATLSGGQRQRVAMGRAIARDPVLFLMDEPFSNLDARLRAYMRTEMRGLQERLGVTTLFVTHDQVEAMTMGDRVVVLRAGRVQQLDSPRVLYERPANVFVAGFIGTPPMNFLRGEVLDGDVRVGGASLRVPPAFDEPREVIVGIRPEGILLGGPEPVLEGRTRAVELLGNEAIVHFEVAGEPPSLPELHEVAFDSEALGTKRSGTPLVARVQSGTPVPTGAAVPLSIRPDDVHLFDAITHAVLPPRGSTA